MASGLLGAQVRALLHSTIETDLNQINIHVEQTQNQPASRRRPNIVVILADDMGWNDVGYRNRGNEAVLETPNIDRLAADGVVLDNYYVRCTDASADFGSYRCVNLDRFLIDPVPSRSNPRAHRRGQTS